jgi:hypothetical protein
MPLIYNGRVTNRRLLRQRKKRREETVMCINAHYGTRQSSAGLFGFCGVAGIERVAFVLRAQRRQVVEVKGRAARSLGKSDLEEVNCESSAASAVRSYFSDGRDMSVLILISTRKPCSSTGSGGTYNIVIIATHLLTSFRLSGGRLSIAVRLGVDVNDICLQVTVCPFTIARRLRQCQSLGNRRFCSGPAVARTLNLVPLVNAIGARSHSGQTRLRGVGSGKGHSVGSAGQTD